MFEKVFYRIMAKPRVGVENDQYFTHSKGKIMQEDKRVFTNVDYSHISGRKVFAKHSHAPVQLV